MSWKKSRKTLITFCLASLLGLFLSGLPTRVFAQQLNLQVEGRSALRSSADSMNVATATLSRSQPNQASVSIASHILQLQALTEDKICCNPPNSFVEKKPSFPLISSPQMNLWGKSKIQNPKSKIALTQNEERRRLPGRREPAAGRGCGINISKPPLTALSPETNLGFTAVNYPTFFFYIPQLPAKAIKFTLLKEDQNKVYEKTFPSPTNSGIFSLKLSSDKTMPPLEVGKGYHWYFQIICLEHDDGDTYVDGWVQRVAPNSTPTSQLDRTAPRQQLSGDRKNNFWYDTLATLAEKRRLNPGDGALTAEWENLLRSEGLNAIAQKPLVGSLPGEGF
jgi:hypothetical protein